jgi:hypothetical protein
MSRPGRAGISAVEALSTTTIRIGVSCARRLASAASSRSPA